MINKLIERMFEEAEDYAEYMWLAEWKRHLNVTLSIYMNIC